MNRFINYAFILLLSISGWWACGNDDKAEDSGASVDKSTTCKSASEGGAYTTFFKPTTGWVGDPMPFYDNGKFYVFYLQDWRDGSAQFHPWHMASTTAFDTFNYTGEAIPCGSDTEQDIAIGTGSVIKANGKYYAFYTGHRWNHTASQPREAVMLATSSDLKTWTKVPSFTLFAADGYDKNEFRDPFLIYDSAADNYKMLVSTRYNNMAVLAHYTSTNLIDWTLQEPLYSDPSVFMVECPDLFQQGNYWYLIYSDINDRTVHYKISHSINGPWTTPTNTKLDGIAFYAGKTASDDTNRYLCGWCPSRSGETDGGTFDWAGSLVTHRLIQNSDGTLSVAIPDAIDTQYSQPIDIEMISHNTNASVQSGKYVLGDDAYTLMNRLPASAKISFKATANQATTGFGIAFGACGTQDEVYAIRLDLQNQLLKMDKETVANGITTAQTITQVPLTVPANRVFDLKLVLEKSVVTVYVNNQVALTNRIYKMNQNPWMLFVDKGWVDFENLAANSK